MTATHHASRVRRLDVDPMGHMNNAADLDLVEDALAAMPDAEHVPVHDCYPIGYVRPAPPGATLDGACWPTDGNAAACRISDSAGPELTRVLVSQAETRSAEEG